MKIAMVCHKYFPDIGGVETHVREISERLVKHGFDVEVICTDPLGKYPKSDYYNDVKITRLRSLTIKDAFYFAPQIFFKKIDADIIHLHNYHAFPAIFASLGRQQRLIFTPHYHGASSSYIRNLLLKPYKFLGATIYDKAEKIICVSKYEMKLIEQDFAISNSKLVHIPNGLKMDEFKDIKDMKKNSRTILYAGRLEPYKGIQYLIESLPLLEEYRLEIIGTGTYEKELHKLAQRLNVYDRIDWLKNLVRGEFLSHYKSADVFVNLSTFEAYGITVAEALACGTPCVVSKGGALEAFIKDDECVGLSFPIDINLLADKIKSMKKFAPRLMPDWEDIASELIKIYLRRSNNE